MGGGPQIFGEGSGKKSFFRRRVKSLRDSGTTVLLIQTREYDLRKVKFNIKICEISKNSPAAHNTSDSCNFKTNPIYNSVP